MGYILCTSPRSGSTLLCMMLRDAGAGAPQSLLYDLDPKSWAEDLGVSGDSSRPDVLRAIFAAARVEGMGKSRHFALRQQRKSFPAVQEALAKAYPEVSGDLERLHKAFGPLHFLYLRRNNKLAQAISLLRAEATGLWHLGADGTEVERNPSQRIDRYDPEAIARTMRLFHSYDAGWRNWFAAQGLTPLELTYEALAEDPFGQLSRALTFLNVPAAGASSEAGPDQKTPAPKAPLTKLADETSQEWTQRFKEDPLYRSVSIDHPESL